MFQTSDSSLLEGEINVYDSEGNLIATEKRNQSGSGSDTQFELERKLSVLPRSPVSCNCRLF